MILASTLCSENAGIKSKLVGRLLVTRRLLDCTFAFFRLLNDLRALAHNHASHTQTNERMKPRFQGLEPEDIVEESPGRLPVSSACHSLTQ